MADDMCPPTSTKNNPASRPRWVRHTPSNKTNMDYTTVDARRTIQQTYVATVARICPPRHANDNTVYTNLFIVIFFLFLSKPHGNS